MQPRLDRRREQPFARVALLALVGLLLVPVTAHAGRIRLAWDANSEPSVTGYMLYYGTASGTFTQSIDVGASTTYTVQSLTNGTRFYFVVKAYTGTGALSAASNEVNGVPTNVAPSVLNPGNFTQVSGAFLLAISASDADFDALTYSASGLPAGLSINTSTGVISGIVPAGTHNVTVTVNDGADQASTTFTITATANPALPPIIGDTFTGPDGTLLAGRVTEVGAAVWQVWGAPGVMIQANAARPVGAGPEFQAAVVEVGAADVTVTSEYVFAGGAASYCGVIVRATDANHYVIARYYDASVALFRRESAGWTLLGSSSVPAVGAGTRHRLSVAAAGSTLTAAWDGAVVLTRTDPFNATATRHGVSSAPFIDTGTAHDDFEVTLP